jgi:transcriptional regulator with XRE-family HTH domain
MTLQMVIRRLQKYIDGHPSEAQAATALGISPQYLNDVKQGRREPGPKLLKALGLKRVPYYEDASADNS